MGQLWTSAEQSSFGVHAIVANHYFEGASYPVGGASRIAETVAPVIERSGGKIVVNAEVSEILVKQNKAIGVRMADGREFRAGAIVSDTGAHRTFYDLLRESPSTLEKVRANLRRIPPSTAHLCLYVGVKESAGNLGTAGTNLWIHPTPDHDANPKRIKADSNAAFAFLYISFPSAKDPDFERRHPDRSTVEVVTLTPRTPILNLYLTGQDVVTLGVAGALLGGVVRASAMLRCNLISTLSKSVGRIKRITRIDRGHPMAQKSRDV
jgi:phytoene dehydrogenase-like protein